MHFRIEYTSPASDRAALEIWSGPERVATIFIAGEELVIDAEPGRILTAPGVCSAKELRIIALPDLPAGKSTKNFA